LLKTIKKIINPVLNIIENIRIATDFREARAGSFPFISGDTFRCVADYVIDHESDINRFSIPIVVSSHYGTEKNVCIIFVALSAVESPVLQLRFLDWLSLLSSSINLLNKKIKLKIIFHNGDKTPDINFYKQVKSNSDEVFSVNVNDDIAGVTPIPIGLENLHHLKNGLLSDFMNYKKFTILEDEKECRSRYILCSFNIHTNQEQREPLMNAIKFSRHEFCGAGMSAPIFRRAVSESFFVISPPGNGNDCHRTWEAIALGAVPVVKTGTLAKSLINYLPIHEVENWEEFLALTDFELKNLFYQYEKRPVTRALMTYWSSFILDC